MVGIDILEIDRVKGTPTFVKKIACQSEIEYINMAKETNMRLQKIAALFCVKEAVMKALGAGKDSGITFLDITLYHKENGQPYVELKGKAKQIFDKNFAGKKIEVSLSHSKTVATAIAIIV